MFPLIFDFINYNNNQLIFNYINLHQQIYKSTNKIFFIYLMIFGNVNKNEKKYNYLLINTKE